MEDKGQADIVNFLEDRFTLKSESQDPLEGISPKQLVRIVAEYRELSLATSEKKSLGSSATGQQSRLVSSGFQSGNPDLSLIRRSALYFDTFVVDDPLVRLSGEPRQGEEAIGKLLGAPVGSDLRSSMQSALRYIRAVLPAVRAGFLELHPLSVLYEPPKEMVLTASNRFFEDALPDHILNWFWSRVNVQKAVRSEQGHWQGLPADASEPTRAIWISYEGHEDVTRLLFLVDHAVDEAEGDGHFTTRMKFPDSPPTERQFDAWKYQSVNQVSADTYYRILGDIYQAAMLDSQYLAPTPFVSDLLALNMMPDKSRGAAVAQPVETLALNINLPIIENADLAKLMKLRHECQEELANLRSFLRSEIEKTLEYSSTTAASSSITHIEEHIQNELVPDLKDKVSRVKRDLALDGIVILASLGAAIPTGGFSLGLLPIAVAAGVNGIRARRDFIREVKHNPASFLWRLSS